ncbi:MAG: hypothetical protein ACOH1I_08770 [Gallionellaceae bacterium]|jgi:hypothetical protein
MQDKALQAGPGMHIIESAQLQEIMARLKLTVLQEQAVVVGCRSYVLSTTELIYIFPAEK